VVAALWIRGEVLVGGFDYGRFRGRVGFWVLEQVLFQFLDLLRVCLRVENCGLSSSLSTVALCWSRLGGQ